MEVLLLTDINGIGKKNDLLVVKDGYALNHLLPSRKALVVTPTVRKRYAEQIKGRAVQREQERAIQMSLSSALSGKTIHLLAKAAKGGKLYASVTPATIAETLKAEYGIDLPASSIALPTAIKTAGQHTVTISIGAQSQQITVQVKAQEEKKEKSKE